MFHPISDAGHVRAGKTVPDDKSSRIIQPSIRLRSPDSF
jgi:hypothetical protein